MAVSPLEREKLREIKKQGEKMATMLVEIDEIDNALKKDKTSDEKKE